MTRRTYSEQRKYEKTVLMWFAALALIGFTAGYALATPWTDENGNPNPECLSKHCHETGIPDPRDPTGGSYDPREPGQVTAEVHNGFSCYYAPRTAWVYHTAARFNMSPQHDAAAKNEALDRLERLGDAVAKTKVCRQWAIKAGFKIAEVLG